MIIIFLSWSVIFLYNSNSKLTDSEANTTDHTYSNKRAARPNCDVNSSLSRNSLTKHGADHYAINTTIPFVTSSLSVISRLGLSH